MRGGIESRLLLYAALVGLAGLLAGCATTGETETIQQNLSILNERQAALEKRLQGAEGASQKGGDLYARLEEIQSRMRVLNGRLEELEHKFDQLQHAQAQAPQSAAPPSGPVVMEGAPPSQQPGRPQPQSPVVLAPAPSETVRPRPAAPEQAEAPAGKSAERIEFDEAAQLMQQKKYEAARKGFQGLVSKYPKSELTESALYEIGESYFLEKRYEDAIKAYQQVMDTYPKGAKVPSALLRQGMGWQQMGEATMARIIYTRLVEKYPGTSQAQAADKKLQQM
jgi:tol-pal system protein YbgF